MNILIIIDMQNDFITGSLINFEAEKIVNPICDLILDEDKHWDRIYFTLDTHGDDYYDTPEGKKLPIKHCVKGTWGWQINNEIAKAYKQWLMQQPMDKNVGTSFEKDKFCFDWFHGLTNKAELMQPDMNITIVGTCTDICVVTNALNLKMHYPYAKIKVLSKLCAGTNKENHDAALKVMKSCQIDVR